MFWVIHIKFHLTTKYNFGLKNEEQNHNQQNSEYPDISSQGIWKYFIIYYFNMILNLKRNKCIMFLGNIFYE